MVLPPNQLIHIGPDPAGAGWNHFDLGLGLTTHINYPQSQLGNSPPVGAPWFYSKTNVDGKDVVVFSAPLGGATTSTNTQYARCELREYERDGTTKAAWDPKSGDHWVEGIYRIYGLTGLQKPEVTIQQAHDANDDTIMVSTYQGGLRLRYNGTQVAVLDSTVADGDEFYLKTRVLNGTPMVYYSANPAVPSTTPVTTSPSSSGFFSGAGTGWYYKTGSYNQTNENTDPNVNPDTSIIRVEVRELKHWHSVTPAGGAWPTPAAYAAAGSPTVDAGADTSILPSGTFNRTASVTLNGATLTSQKWEILSGPAGAGTQLSTAAACSWTPSAAGGGSSVPIGQTTVFNEKFDNGVTNANWSSIQTHTYEDSPDGYNMGSEYRMSIVNDASSATVLRTEVHDGDTAVGSHERCEISSFGKFWNDNNGDERWYEFDVKFEALPSFGSSDDWLIFFQWHNVSLGDAPPLAMAIHQGGMAYFEREPDSDFEFIPIWTPVINQWHHVVVHIKWSSNPSVGFIECHVDGVQKVAKRTCRTQYTGDENNQYVKLGQYRRSSISGTSTVKHDNIRVSTLPAVSGGGATTYPNGTYVLQYTAVTSAGTFTDSVNVAVTPDAGGGPGGGVGVYPSFVTAGPTATSNGSGTVTVPNPTGVVAGQFQVCIMQFPEEENVTAVPAGWFLLDQQNVPNTAQPSKAYIYYNTTGDSAFRSWTKSGSGGYHAIRMVWKDWSALGQHLARGSADTLTPYAPQVTPATDKALVITVLGSDRMDTGAGPVSVPTGWTQRYNNGPTVNSNQIEWIAVGELQVASKTPTGTDAPGGTGVGTSNFALTNSDNCSMFSFVLEGVLSTGVTANGAVSLTVQKTLSVNTVPPTVRTQLTISATLLAWSMVRGSVTLSVGKSLVVGAAVYPRGTMLIIPTLSFTGGGAKLFQLGSVQLPIIVQLWASSLPYRKPVLRTDYKYPPRDHPFRLIAQRILDGEIVEWELPVGDDFEYVEQLSGPVVMKGSFRPEIISVQELNLDGYAYWLHVEINQQIRASAILLPPQYEESAMTFSAEGIAAAPHYHIYDGVFQQIQVDPLSVVRTIWNYVQSQPQSDLGVMVSSLSSPVRLGEAARTEVTTTTDGQGVETITTREIPPKPYELVWWNATNCGEEIDTLAGQTPFDYTERHEWNSTRTDVLHYFDIGYPRIGVQKPNLLFNEENILEVVPIQEAEDSYASAVLVIGAGEGEDTIRAYTAQSFGDRVRKEVVITDKTITTQERANARAFTELAIRRGRAFEIAEIVISAYHTNAPIGSYRAGDDIRISVEIPWLMETHIAWYRITSISNKPSSDKVRIGVSHASAFDFTQEIIVIPPDAYIPFEPPTPGATLYPSNVSLIISPALFLGATLIPALIGATLLTINKTLILGGSVARTGAVSLTIGETFTASGIATSATGGTATLIVNKTLTAGAAPTAFAAVAFTATTTLTTGGVTTRPAAVSMTVGKTLTASGTVIIAVGFGATPFGSVPFGSGGSGGSGAAVLSASTTLTASSVGTSGTGVSLASTETLTVGAKLTEFAAVTLSIGKTLTAGGTVSAGTTTSIFGKDTDGAGSSSSTGNKTTVSKHTAGVAGTITAGHARLWVDSGTASVQMVVYADSSGNPGALLGLSDALTVSNTTEAQKDFTFTGAQQVAIVDGTDYWLGFTWADPGTNTIFWSRDTTSGLGQQNNAVAPNPFGTPTAVSGLIDAYVDVISQGSGGGGSGTLTGPGTSPPIAIAATDATTVTTVPFNVPANSVLVAVVGTNHYGTSTYTGETWSFSNNGAATTWSQAVKRSNADRGAAAAGAAIYVTPIATARTGMTVTATVSAGAGTASDPILSVYVVPGADMTTPVGGVAGGFGTANVLTTGGVTMSQAGSLLFVAGMDYDATGTPTSSNLTISGHVGTISAGYSYLTGWRLGGASGASTTANLDAAGSAAVDWTWVAAEIRSA